MINFHFMKQFILSFYFLLPISEITFDKKIAANIYVRMIHSTGCIYHLIPIIYENGLNIFMKKNTMPLYVKDVFDRSISYFLWDCMALLLTDEKEKLIFIIHHIISIVAIGFARFFEHDWYLICFALLLAEITNPLTQISEFMLLTNTVNNNFEKLYFYSMLTTRGIITPCLIILYTYYIYKFFEDIRNIYLLSVLINYSSMNIIMIGSVSWLHKKYLVLYKNNNDKKVS